LAAPEAGPSAEQPGALAQGAAPDVLAVQPAAGAASAADSARESLALIDPTVGGPDAPRADQRIDGDARVILRARERAWIQVSSLAGDYIFRRTLEPGEAYPVPDRADLELWTGNAGGLEVIVDGTPVPALAGGGAVRRHVSLDPDRLLQSAGQPR
jgi:cytoskeleton protein RodZ